MPVAKQAMCAFAWVLLAVAGCTLPDALGLNYLQQTGPGGERVVAGSLQSVSQSTQATLRQFGMSAIVTEDAGAIRITSQTKKGDRFALVLTSMRSDKGEQTRVKIEWSGHGDEQTGLQILGQLEALSLSAAVGAQK